MKNIQTKRNVTLYAGSFNPPHQGHFEMASYIYKNIPSDEFWMIYSNNPWKKNYLDINHRIAMGNILAQQYDIPFKMSDIEMQIAQEKGTHETYALLRGLRERFPQVNYTWVMGADNFIDFHKWGNYREILETTRVAIVDRPGYTEKALNSVVAKECADFEINLNEVADTLNGWLFLDNPKIDVSSSSIRQLLKEGKTMFGKPFQGVANYIMQHNLYDIGNKDRLVF